MTTYDIPAGTTIDDVPLWVLIAVSIFLAGFLYMALRVFTIKLYDRIIKRGRSSSLAVLYHAAVLVVAIGMPTAFGVAWWSESTRDTGTLAEIDRYKADFSSTPERAGYGLSFLFSPSPKVGTHQTHLSVEGTEVDCTVDRDETRIAARCGDVPFADMARLANGWESAAGEALEVAGISNVTGDRGLFPGPGISSISAVVNGFPESCTVNFDPAANTAGANCESLKAKVQLVPAKIIEQEPKA